MREKESVSDRQTDREIRDREIRDREIRDREIRDREIRDKENYRAPNKCTISFYKVEG